MPHHVFLKHQKNAEVIGDQGFGISNLLRRNCSHEICTPTNLLIRDFDDHASHRRVAVRAENRQQFCP